MGLRIELAVSGTLVVLGAGCHGGPAGPDANDPVLAKAAASGDGQAGSSGTLLAQPLVVMATLNGSPVADVKVAWALLAGGGVVAPITVRTGADGTASTTVTLPPYEANFTVVASATGLNGSPVEFSVAATGATSTATFRVVDAKFQPQEARMRAGGTVSFIWGNGAGAHNVTPVPPNTAPASINQPPPATHRFPFSFSAVIPAAGSYGFFCGVDGAPGSGMHGTLTVVP